VPPDVPLHRTRAEQFDDFVLQAVARLEPQWEAHLSGVEFAVEEIPPAGATATGPRGQVPLSRLEPGTAPPGQARPPEPRDAGPRPEPLIARETPDAEAGRPEPHPPRIVVYRRPLTIRADGDEELGDLVFDVVVEEFARLLGIDPTDVDPGYAGGD
jgi:predicted Zn-dependent protease with MMP-like domain